MLLSLKAEFKLIEVNDSSKFDTFEKNIELKISDAINTICASQEE